MQKYDNLLLINLENIQYKYIMSITNYLRLFITINGFFDIIGGASIILNIPYLRDTHLAKLKRYDNLQKRFFAYWVINYGAIRLMSTNPQLLEASYFLEALFYLIELRNKTVNVNMSCYSVSSCLMIAGLLHNVDMG